MSVAFTLNGRPTSMASPPETPLLWALRDEKNLVGVKFGCGAGLCGACTVIVDGQQTRSCLTRLADATDRKPSRSGKIARRTFLVAAGVVGGLQPWFAASQNAAVMPD